MQADPEEIAFLIIVGIASIRVDVLLSHISRTLEIIAAQKVKRTRQSKSAVFMQAHPIVQEIEGK